MAVEAVEDRKQGIGIEVVKVNTTENNPNWMSKVPFNPRVPTGTPRWETSMQILKILATRGYSTRLDLNLALYQEERTKNSLQSRTRRALSDLERSALIMQENWKLQNKVDVYVVRLTDLGKNFCLQQGWIAVESEFERLVRKHNGEDQQRHTVAVLVFAYHARRCGYDVEILPPPVFDSYEADVLVRSKDRKVQVHVEVEMKPLSSKLGKWKNMGAAVGLIAICTVTEKRCEAFGRMLRKWEFGYFRLTDLQSLARFSHTPEDELYQALFFDGEG